MLIKLNSVILTIIKSELTSTPNTCDILNLNLPFWFTNPLIQICKLTIKKLLF